MRVTHSQAAAAAELAKRRSDALGLFRLLPGKQEAVAHCKVRETLIRGGNRSGKSTLAAMRFAAIATDRPIYDSKGRPIEMRLPHQKGRPLTMWLVGYKNDHIGQTLHRLLFRPGLFKVIRDKNTNLWRAFRPWDADDKAREDQAKPSPPLIPPRFIKPGSWSWESKSERVFTKVEIIRPGTNEVIAEIYAFSSMGEVKAGDPVDEIWIDEAIKFPKHYEEWQARIIDRRGRITWSSWPRITNMALVKLTQRAREEERELAKTAPEEIGKRLTVREFVLTMSENPHLSEDAKADALQGWTEDERRARDQGEYLTDNLRMYPKFSRMVHTAVAVSDDDDDLVSEVLRENNGEPPDDWTRELILDPGTAFPAILLGAVPPPDPFGSYLVVYREINRPRYDADELAEIVLAETHGYHFERFIVDPHAARQKPMGFGGTVGGNYSRAFAARGLTCRQSGSQFTPGSDDVDARIRMVQAVMTIRRNGRPKLRVYVPGCPALCDQLENYLKAVDANEQPLEKPATGQRIDLAQCLEYWVSRDPQYVEPPVVSDMRSGPGWAAYQKFVAKRKRSEGESKSTVTCGPPSAA